MDNIRKRGIISMKFNPRSDVMNFIKDFNKMSDDLRGVFMNGYCYHFALILSNMFDGEILWHKGYGHIVCRIDDLCYDIEGVCDDYTPEEYVPISVLKESIESFKHRGHDCDIDNDMNHCSILAGISIDELYKWIYDKIPAGKAILSEANQGDSEIWWTTFRKSFLSDFNITEENINHDI